MVPQSAFKMLQPRSNATGVGDGQVIQPMDQRIEADMWRRNRHVQTV